MRKEERIEGLRELREHVFLLLFRREFHEPSEMEEQTTLYFQSYPFVAPQMIEAARERYALVCERLGEIDTILLTNASGWKLNRMGKVELNLLRLAVFELLYDEEMPPAVAINEAVELGKKYGSETAAGFINGVLAKVVRYKPEALEAEI